MEIIKDNAGRISDQAWRWYKKARDMNEKGDAEWTVLINEANDILQEYKDTDDSKFAMDMVLLFIDRIERLERKRKENDERRKDKQI